MSCYQIERLTRMPNMLLSYNDKYYLTPLTNGNVCDQLKGYQNIDIASSK